MTYYHCSPTAGLTMLEPRKPELFSKPVGVYLTTLLPMALMYGIQNYEDGYGYTREGRIHYDEYFPNALEILYRGQCASLYLCDPQNVRNNKIPNEVVSDAPVYVICEVHIPGIFEALLEQERLGALVIHRHHDLPQKALDWIRHVQADTIREHRLLQRKDHMAAYYKSHYPES